nr:MAG TPA: hypothetical protein [Caudoviricetes sp.]
MLKDSLFVRLSSDYGGYGYTESTVLQELSVPIRLSYSSYSEY